MAGILRLLYIYPSPVSVLIATACKPPRTACWSRSYYDGSNSIHHARASARRIRSTTLRREQHLAHLT